MTNPTRSSTPTVTNVRTSRLRLPTGCVGLLLGLLFALIATSQTATALNTAIPYQGRLFTNGLPATGLFDFRLQLYTNAFTTNVSREVLVHDVGVTNGLFNLTVDFGTNAFLQDAWLEVGVRPGADTGAYELLGGRGLLLPVPYAHAARTAEELVGNAAANINALSNALNSAILDESSQRQTSLNATNSALLTAFAADLLTTTNGLSSRLIATNTALVSALLAEGALRTNADNSLSATLLSVTNGLSARLIATNDALVLAMAADLLSASNALSARLLATNTALLGALDSASNVLSGRLLATNDALVAFVTNRTGWTVVSGTAQNAVANQSYLLTNAAQTTVTLPASPAVGDVVEIAGTGAGGWVAQTGTSTPAGETWTARESNRNWLGVASSSDGTKLVAAPFGGQLYTSTDSGVNWTARDSVRNWSRVASSADGTKLVAAVENGQLYTSTDSGATWPARESSRNWRGVASSADGTKLVAVNNGGQIYTSTDSGVNWTARDSSRGWQAVASSADGTKLVAVVNGGEIYTSTDSGATWTARDSSRAWNGVASSADGSVLVAVVDGGQIYTSVDSGVTWTARDSSRGWRFAAVSADGSKMLASAWTGQLYTSVGAADFSLAGVAGSTARLQYVGNNTWQALGEAQLASKVGIGRVAAVNALEVEGDASKTTAGSWLANSDRRIKTNIHDLENPLAVLQKLRPVEFQYTEEYRRQHPFVGDKFYHNVIAQEFQQVFPNAVKRSGEGDILQVDTYPMFITAVGALKQLDGIVKGQATQLQQRDAELQALRQMLLQQQQALEKMREELKALQAK